MRNHSVVFMLLCICFLSGCSIKISKFSLVSTKNVNLNNVKIEKIQDGVIGISKCKTILGFPIDDCKPKVDLAVGDALEKSHGDFLKNVDATYKWWDVIFYGEYFIKVTGDAYSVFRSTGSTLK